MAGTELATAYVSLLVDTAKVGPAINKAFDQVPVAADKAGAKAGSSFSAGVSKTLKFAGGLGLGIGFATAARDVITAGNDVTVTLNTMQAQGGLTDAQMGKVSATAKTLGNDLTLPGVSAATASTSMFELSRAGFSVDDSMKAAKGSLQLAAAAGSDVATAVDIQAGALHAFNLGSDQAGHVADVLANAANNSTASITDIGFALQASGTVANQFGLTVEDTATTLALFSNAGIQGSDAGTLLKTALLALTDQGKPAQAAIEELGLTVYDANGKFVGMESLFGQLKTASAQMTPEMYQAATATLFGSDAARLAGVAATTGAAGFDTMQVAIEKQGTAAEIAAAKNKGLPGAIENIKNAAENAGLAIYDKLKGPLEDATRGATDFINDAAPKVAAGLGTITAAAAPVAGVLTDISQAALDLPSPVWLGAGALALGKFFDIGPKANAAVSTVRGFGDTARLTAMYAQDAGRDIGTLRGGLEAFGAETGRKATTGLTNIVDFLGGPWAIAIGAATVGAIALGTAIYDSATRDERARENQIARTKDLQVAQVDLTKTFIASQGQVDETVKKSAQAFTTKARDDYFQSTLDQAPNFIDKALSKPAVKPSGIGQSIVTSTGAVSKGVETYADQASAGAREVQNAQKLLSDSFSDEQWTNIISGSQSAFDDAVANWRLRADQGTAGADKLADAMEHTRAQFEQAQSAAQNTTTGFFALSDALGTIADKAANVDSKASAARIALQELAGVPIGKQEAEAASAKQKVTGVERIKSLTPEAPIVRRGAAGEVTGFETDVPQAREVLGIFNDQLTALSGVVAAGGDVNKAWGDTQTVIDTVADKFGLTKEDAAALAASVGLIPKNVQIETQLKDAGPTAATLDSIRAKAEQTGQPVKMPIEALDENARTALRDLGIQVKDLPDGTVQIDANTDEAKGKLDEFRLISSEVGKPINVGVQSDDAIARLNTVQGVKAEVLADGTTTITANTYEAQRDLAFTIAMKSEVGKPVVIPATALTAEAEQDLQALGFTVTHMPNGTVQITATTAQAQTDLDAFLAQKRSMSVEVQWTYQQIDLSTPARQAGETPGSTITGGHVGGRASGGALYGGIPGRDSIPILGMEGEHMFDRGDVQAMGGQQAVYDFRRALHMAEGGSVPRGVANAISGARSVTGNAYSWGGTGPTNFDCSGFLGWLQQLIMGQPSNRRLYTTYSLLGGSLAGLQAGLGPSGTYFQVGVNDEHMAGTLAGYPVESGGSHGDSRIGNPAVGATDSQFSNFFHLPNELVDGIRDYFLVVSGDSLAGPTSSAPVQDIRTEEEKVADAIILEGQRRNISEKGIKIGLQAGWAESGMRNLDYGDRDSLGVFQQRASWGSREERMNVTTAAGKFFDALAKIDYESMEPELAAQAVQRSAFKDGSNYKAQESRASDSFRDFEDRLREGGGKSPKGPSPEAPGMGGLTDEQIELERAQMAVDDARIKRNDVYADATKSERERREADLDLASAENRLTKLREEQAKKGKEGKEEPKSISERLKELGSELVGIGVDAALDQLPYDIGRSHWWGVPILPGKKALTDVPDNFTKTEVDQQYPVTTNGDPGLLAPYVDSMPDWMRKIVEGGVNIADSGGWLEPGDLALNLSRRPEPIFSSPNQLAQFAGAMFPGHTGGHGEGSLVIEKVVGYSPDEVAREVMKQFRVNQMRYGGRRMASS